MNLIKMMLKPYIQYKIKDIIQSELKSMIDESYENPYFQDKYWQNAAWIAHQKVKEAYDNAKQEIYNIVNKVAAEKGISEEQKQKVLDKIKFIYFITKDGQPGLDIKIMEE